MAKAKKEEQQCRGQLSDAFGLSGERYKELQEPIVRVWNKKGNVEQSIKTLLKGLTRKEMDIAYQFTIVGMKIEKNNQNCECSRGMHIILATIEKVGKKGK